VPSTTAADVPECATDLTSDAYVLRVRESDRLGNEAVINAATGPFGVDRTPPEIEFLSTAPADLTTGIGGDVGTRFRDLRSGLATTPLRRVVARLGGSYATLTCIDGGAPKGTLLTPLCPPAIVKSGYAGPDKAGWVTGGAVPGTPGGYYQTYEATVYDRAGNASATVARRLGIETGKTGQVTLLTAPDKLDTRAGAPAPEFSFHASDDLELRQVRAYVEYNAAMFLLGTITTSVIFDDKIESQFDARFQMPGIYRGLEQVLGHGTPNKGAPSTKPQSVLGYAVDLAGLEGKSALAIASRAPDGVLYATIGGALALFRWTVDATGATATAEGPTGIGTNPFGRVDLVEVSEPWEKRVSLTAFSITDNGVRRFYTYKLPTVSGRTYMVIGVNKENDAIATTVFTRK
jgi:hypothetical protein